MKKLNNNDINNLLIGNSWFATGGGFPREKAKEIFSKILREKKLILKGLDEFADDDYLCVGSGVGSVEHTSIDITRNSTKAIKILENITGKKIKGIVSGEIGLECIAAETASKLNLSLVDTDMKGGRAAPEPSINMFNLKHKKVTPMVAINTDEDISILKNISDQQKIELFLRNFSNMASGTFVAWCPSPARQFKKILINKTISKTINLGKMILETNNLSQILRNFSGQIIFEGIISNIEDQDVRGFLIRRITVKNGKLLSQVWIRNENLVVTINNQVVVTCPDLITIINPINNLGIHNSKLKIGKKVIIITLHHDKRWHSRFGHKLFGPRHFGLPFCVKRI